MSKNADMCEVNYNGRTLCEQLFPTVVFDGRCVKVCAVHDMLAMAKFFL